MTAPTRVAAIDVGTNTVLLTIAECSPQGIITPLLEAAQITRIGEGLGTRASFVEPAMARTLAVLQAYAERCREMHVERISCVGTAAFRRADNSAAFVQRVAAECGFTIQIISGQHEAQLSFHAAAHDFGEKIFVLDIGGGSTGFMWMANDRVQVHSFPMGSVTLQEEFCHSDPINAADYAALQQHIDSLFTVIEPLVRQRPPQLVALAGTATTLAAMHLALRTYSHDQVHGTQLSIDAVDALLQRLSVASVAERQQMIGLEPARADVILSGTMLLHITMQRCGYDRVTISDRGVRWGLLYEAFGSH